MEKKKRNRIIIGISIFCVIYVIFALRPLGTELHLSPEWTVSIDRLKEKKDGDVPIPFQLGQSIGYFTEDGRIITSLTYPFNSAISSTYYATYGADNIKTSFFRADGNEAGSISIPGFPFFDEDRIFVFLPGGSAVVQCDMDGKKRWEYESYAPITSFASSKGGTVIGFADGVIVSLTPDGSIDQRYSPGGSETDIILGTGISEDGSLIACISGQNQQRFVVSARNGEHSKIIFHEYLPQDFNRQVMVKFNRKSDTVYYNYNGGLGILSLDRLKSSHIPLEGYVVQIEEAEMDGMVFILSRKDRRFTVTVLEPFAHPVATFQFDAESAFIQVRDNALFVGRDNKISKLSISKR